MTILTRQEADAGLLAIERAEQQLLAEIRRIEGVLSGLKLAREIILENEERTRP
jgi:hypothetical protein